MNTGVGRALGQNMQSAYNLLPSPKYFEKISEPVITFDNNAFRISNFAPSTATATSFSLMATFLNGGGVRSQPVAVSTNLPSVLRQDLIGRVSENHALLDEWVPSSKISIYQFVGWGRGDTIKTVHYESVPKNTCRVEGGVLVCEPVYSPRVTPIFTMEGDKTVVSSSADFLNGTTSYFNINSYQPNTPNFISLDHKAILEAPAILDAISAIVLSTTTEPSPYLTHQKPVPTSPILSIAMHSPVSISATDGKGNFTGVIAITDPDWEGMTYVREGIANSGYHEIGEEKFLVLPTDASTTVSLQGLGSGTFTLNIDRYEGDVIVGKESFVNLPVTPLLQGALTTIGVTTTLQLDVNGDGVKDVSVAPSNEFNPRVFLAVLRQTVLLFDVKKQIKDRILKKIDRIDTLLEKDKSKMVEGLLFRSVNNLEIKKYWQKKLTAADRESLITSFEQMINSL